LEQKFDISSEGASAPTTAFRVVVDCSVKAESWKASLPRARAIATKTMAAALTAAGIETSNKGVRDLEISLVLADDAFVRELNRDYRGKDQPTNVLSFPSLEGADLERLWKQPSRRNAQEEILLGDLVLAFETVEREALEAEKLLKDHFCHLVVHGLLHLIGYDHVVEAEAEKMEALETAILSGIGIKDPYQ
jgi:probable rRNA maturation factor